MIRPYGMDPVLDGEIFFTWKKKRRNTLIGYIIIGAIVGIDYSIVLSTLFNYLDEVIQTQSPEVYYGVVMAVFSISSTIFGLISGRLVDKTRQIKMYVNIVFILQILGSLIYVIPYSVAFPVIGRLLAGIGDPFVNVCSGEVIRIYDEKGGTQALWWLATTYSIGFVVGPALSVLFKSVDFHIGSVPISHLNFVGLFMAGLSLVVLVVANTLIHDCSAEFDLKEYIRENYGDKNSNFAEDYGDKRSTYDEHYVDKEDSSMVTYKNDNEKDLFESERLIKNDSHQSRREIPLGIVLKGLFTNFDIMLLFLSTFIFMFCLFGTDLMIPLLAVEIFQWNDFTVSYIFIAYGICYFVILFVMARFFNTNDGVYISTLLCTFCQILQYVLLIVIKTSKRNKVHDIAVFVWFLLFCLMGWCIEEVLIRSMVAKMVPSSIQSFTETIRSSLARISTIIVSFTVPFLMTCAQWYSATVIVVLLVLFICFLVRRGQLISPKEIVFNN